MSLHSLFSRRSPRSRTSPRPRRRSFRPRLEWLEGRDLPSTLVVTDPGDSGAGTLRQLLADANPGDTIAFDPSVTAVTLTSGSLTVAKDVTIQGPAGGQVTVARSAAAMEFRVFAVNSNVTASFTGLKITGGRAIEGAGIFNQGALTLTNVEVAGNSGSAIPLEFFGKGAGIYNGGGTMIVTNGNIHGNAGAYSVYTSPEGDVYVAGYAGGGIYNDGGNLVVSRSEIVGNQAGGNGGGIFTSGGSATVIDSTIAGNTAAYPYYYYYYGIHFGGYRGSGGGILSDSVLTLTGSTVSGNSGAAVEIDNGSTAALNSTTIWGNQGIGLQSSGGDVILTNTIVTTVSGAVDPASHHNLISSADASLTGISNGANGNQIGTTAAPIDPLLGPLADNGGPTQTMLPQRGSPAIDAGSNEGAPDTDQRGFRRVFGGVIDLGAVETMYPGQSRVGTFDSSTGTWYLHSAVGAGAPDAGQFPYGGAGWLPVAGDWDGDGITTVGVVDPATATWYLRNENSPGGPDVAAPFAYGLPGWVPVAGDWSGTGHTGIGMFDPATGTWYLRNEDNAGPPDAGVFQYGGAGWLPVVGDWDGDGKTTIGVVDPGSMTWYLRNSNTAGAPDFTPFQYGGTGWRPVVGNWTGGGTTTVGVVDPNGVWYLRDSNSGGGPDVTPFPYGLGSWTPVAGHWLGAGGTGSTPRAASLRGPRSTADKSLASPNGAASPAAPAATPTAPPAYPNAAATGPTGASPTPAARVTLSDLVVRRLSSSPASGLDASLPDPTRADALDRLFAAGAFWPLGDGR
jgi:hypothetical protein